MTQEIDYPSHDAMQNPARKAQIRMLKNTVDTLRRCISSSTWMRANKNKVQHSITGILFSWLSVLLLVIFLYGITSLGGRQKIT